jgi:hypothetical protein
VSVPHDDLPRIGSLDATAIQRARVVVMHSPQAVPASAVEEEVTDGAAFRWAVTLTDVQGVAIGREHVTVPDLPTPLGEIVRLHLDLIGLRVEGRWVTDLGHDDLPRHAARVVRGDPQR